MKTSVVFSHAIIPFIFLEQASPAIADTGSHWFLISLIVVLSLILLIVAVFWLLKDSTLLEETFGKNETEGRSWLKNHLNELSIEQLETLINLKSMRVKKTLPNEDPDQK